MSIFEMNHIDPAFVSAITALVAVFAGPLVTMYVARRQLKASVVSSNRQQWINRLRDELAALVKDIRHVTPAYASDSILRSEAISVHGQITGRVELIKLLINPNENDHQELHYLIDKASEVVISAINSKQGKADELSALADKIVDKAQIILKREWERVKKGE